MTYDASDYKKIRMINCSGKCGDEMMTFQVSQYNVDHLF